jgi:hypothetical protein
MIFKLAPTSAKIIMGGTSFKTVLVIRYAVVTGFKGVSLSLGRTYEQSGQCWKKKADGEKLTSKSFGL